ncbi:hypothetical protein [Clostridium cibarium]|uniref:Uncharacterized protein n=1 Tax=Clostridium cibarium TaxID=2762247 RepID=A0ABR8PSM2_9CLOT|nr:hypothetical protein [Clostridium cibarium]MBD7911177.1 hypothetical protein [Clostridium cibarium]
MKVYFQNIKSFIVNYDSKKSDEIIVNLDGYVNEDYNEEKLLDPFIETMKGLPIKDSIEYWNEEHFGILYYGKKSFGYNTDGNVKAATKAPTELIGYFASLYVPGKEKTYMPYRYALEEDLANIKQEEQLKKNKEEEDAAKKASSDTEQFYLSDKVGFVCLSHSGGITVELYGTQDGGHPSKR